MEWFNLLSYLMMIYLRLEANHDELKADDIQGRCPGWARFLRRRARKRRLAAKVWSHGDDNTYGHGSLDAILDDE